MNFYYSLLKSFEFDGETFDLLYQKFEKETYKEQEEKYLVICPLQNFKMEEEKLILGKNLEIKKIPFEVISKVEKDRFDCAINSQEIEFAVYSTGIYDTSNGFDFIDSYDKSNITQSFLDIVSALRIFKRGDLCMPLKYFAVSLDWGVGSGGGLATCANIFNPFFKKDQYELKKDEILKFQEFWKNFYKKPIEKNVKIAIKRFNYFYDRHDLEDNIIDSMIALEALFKIRNNKKKMVAINTAFRLGKNESEIKKISEFLSESYEDRSGLFMEEKQNRLKMPNLKKRLINFKSM